MKAEFKEFYHPDEKDKIAIKEDAIFIFDASTLLNLYKLSSKDRSGVLKIMAKLGAEGRLWQPHQFCYEYQQHRLEVIKTEVNKYDEIIRDVDKYFGDLDKVPMRDSHPKHPLVRVGIILKIIKQNQKITQKASISKIREFKNKHPNWTQKDPIREKLTSLFLGKIGREYTDEELETKYQQGEVRYKNFKPPGFSDVDKDPEDVTKKKKYGDLIAWFQIVDKAREIRKPIVLVTDDLKEDWWVIDKKKNRHGPRKELVKEMYKEAGVIFELMDTSDFFVFADQNFGLDISKRVIADMQEATKVSEESRDNLEEASPLVNSPDETVDKSGDVGVASLEISKKIETKNNDLPEIEV